MDWILASRTVQSRLLLGTALYPSLDDLQAAVVAAETNVITVSLRRQSAGQSNGKNGNAFWDWLKTLNCHILPNTAGCRTAKEAITTAQMAREVFNTQWIKLEVIGDEYALAPDPFALVIAAKELISQGFEVFPYCTDDLVVAQKLVDAGCRIIMPWAAPIGSGQGLLNPFALKTLRARLPDITIIIDAGIGAPSQAALALELGCDGVLINTAVALAQAPAQMAAAFAHAVRAGRLAYHAGLMEKRDFASPSTPVLGTPFWQQETL
jgi:thiazole synthase